MHVQHTGSDRSIWFGNPFSLISRLQEAAQDQEAIARTGDLQFALTRLLESPSGAKIDTKNIIVAGHSYGSNTALLASGARVSRNGIPMNFRDPRITAAILISTPPFMGKQHYKIFWGQLRSQHCISLLLKTRFVFLGITVDMKIVWIFLTLLAARISL